MNTYTYELYHWGIKGQKWGVRRYQNKDGTLTPAGKRRKAKMDYDNEIESKRKLLSREGDKLYDQSKEGKWFKKHPNAAADDYDDVIAGNPNYKDPKADKAQELWTRSGELDKRYAARSALGMAVTSSLTSGPIAGVIANKLSKGAIENGKVRTAVVLGSALGTVAAVTVMEYANSTKRHREAIKSEGIKSVKDRVKEM